MANTVGYVSGAAAQRPGEAILGFGYALLVRADQTGGTYELMKFVVPAGLGPPPHCHSREDECFYVIDGTFEVMIGEAAVQASLGTYLHLPRNVPHAFRNVGQTTGSFICWVVPGNLAGFFDAFKRSWPPDADQPPPVNEEDIAKLMAVAPDYGIQILAGH